MLGEPLRADGSEFDQTGAPSGGRKKGDDEYPDGQRHTNQNQHSITSIRETRSVSAGVIP